MHKPRVITTVLFAASLLAVSPAQARDADHQSFQDTFDLCGSGVVVEYAEEVDLHWISRKVGGPSETYSFPVWSDGVVTVTNPDDGRTVTMTYTRPTRTSESPTMVTAPARSTR